MERDRAVGGDARDARGRDDARGARRVPAPHQLAGGAVEAERLERGADDDAIAAEEGRAQIDAGHERAPALRVTEPRGVAERPGSCFGRAWCANARYDSGARLMRESWRRTSRSESPTARTSRRKAARRRLPPCGGRDGRARGRARDRRRAQTRRRRRARARGTSRPCGRAELAVGDSEPGLIVSAAGGTSAAAVRRPTIAPPASTRAKNGWPRSHASRARRARSSMRSAKRNGYISPRSTVRPRISARMRPRTSSAWRSARSTLGSSVAAVAGPGASRTPRRRRSARRDRCRRRPPTTRAPGAEVRRLRASSARTRRTSASSSARGEPDAWRATRRVERIDDARAHLLEHDRTVVDEHGRLGAAAVDAERRGVREALDAELPRVLVEAHDALAAGDPDEVGERPREIAQHARRVTLRDARGDVRAVNEEVEDLVRAHAGSPEAGPRRRGCVGLSAEQTRGRIPALSPRHRAVGRARVRRRFRSFAFVSATDPEASLVPVRFAPAGGRWRNES